MEKNEEQQASPIVEKIFNRKLKLHNMARSAYEAYGRTTGNKNFRGDQMPTWDELPAAIVLAWVAAVSNALANFAAAVLDGDLGCFGKAIARGEPTFTVRGQDQTAAETVEFWAGLNHRAPAAKIAEAMAIADEMRNWPNKKAAD